MLWLGRPKFAVYVVRRVQLLNVGIAGFAESERLTAPLAPGRINRVAGFEMKFIARVRPQCFEKKLVLTEVSGQNRLQARRLPRAPTLIIRFRQPSHCHKQIHGADVTLGGQRLVGGGLDSLREFRSIHL